MDDYDELVQAVFGTQAGRKLLAEWKAGYGDRISFQPDLSSEEVAFREGERSFYRHIEDSINE